MFCLTCKDTKNQLFIEKDKTNIFCGQPCQTKYYSLIGVNTIFDRLTLKTTDLVDKGGFWKLLSYLGPNELPNIVSEIENSTKQTRDLIFEKFMKDNVLITDIFKMSKEDFFLEMFKISINKQYMKVIQTLILHNLVDPSVNDNACLHLTLYYRYKEFTSLLLKDRRVFDKFEKDNFTSFNYIKIFENAVENNNTRVIDKIITNKLIRFENDILKQLLKRNKVFAVKVFLNNKQFELPERVMYHAVKYGRIEIVKLLLQDKRINPSAWFLYVASNNGHIEIVKLLLQDPRIDPSADKYAAFKVAVMNNNFEIVKLLFNKNAKLGGSIIIASESGYYEIVEFLLKYDIDSEDLSYAVVIATKNNHVEIVKLLLQDDRVDPSYDQNDAMRKAYYHGNLEIMKLLLNHPMVRKTYLKEAKRILESTEADEEERKLLEDFVINN
jgi:ankyrin repeat protein